MAETFRPIFFLCFLLSLFLSSSLNRALAIHNIQNQLSSSGDVDVYAVKDSRLPLNQFQAGEAGRMDLHVLQTAAAQQNESLQASAVLEEAEERFIKQRDAVESEGDESVVAGEDGFHAAMAGEGEG